MTQKYGTGQVLIDVHKYDSEVRNINIPTKLSKGFKAMYFSKLRELIFEHSESQVKDKALQVMDILFRDMETPPNFLGSYADDILCEIAILLEEEKDIEYIKMIINLLCEQFTDLVNTSGWCPSGRVSRILCVYVVAKDRIKINI
jgi:hypothetical protein